MRLRLERQFAQQLSAAVAAEVDAALRQMQAQTALDFEHYDYLRQQHERASSDASELRQRLGAANDLARTLLHEVTICSMEAFLIDAPGQRSSLELEPGGALPAAASAAGSPSREIVGPLAPSRRTHGDLEARGGRGGGPLGITRAATDASLDSNTAAQAQIARRALAFLLGRVDLSSVAHALHALVQVDLDPPGHHPGPVYHSTNHHSHSSSRTLHPVVTPTSTHV
jgi:hypothetical protein